MACRAVAPVEEYVNCNCNITARLIAIISAIFVFFEL